MKNVLRAAAAALLLPFSLAAQNGPVEKAAMTITQDDYAWRIGVIAHDSMQGRDTPSQGLDKTAEWIASEFRRFGLRGGMPDGAFIQRYPLLEATVDPQASSVRVQGGITLRYGADVVPMRGASEADATGSLVLVTGAPDVAVLRSADLEGKHVVLLLPPGATDDRRAFFGLIGAAGTSGAASVMLATGEGDDEWASTRAAGLEPSVSWPDESQGRERTPVPMLRIRTAAVARILQGAGMDAERLQRATAMEVTPVPGVTLQVTQHVRTREVSAPNVVGILEGSDPELKDEYVTYVGHVDHFGVGVAVDGDSIYNGAHDNASGLAIVLETAKAFASLPTPPRRSVLFVIATAEEWGLLGSDYFVEHATVPQESLVANFSLDMPFLFHPLLDIVPYGADHTSMGDAVATAAEHMGLRLGPDPIPEQVLFIRSDHFSFIRHGIPALFIKSGFETGDERDGGALNTGYRQQRYHTPFDDMSQDFDFGSGADHARVNFLTGYVIAQQDERPTWNEGDFFAGLFAGGHE